MNTPKWIWKDNKHKNTKTQKTNYGIQNKDAKNKGTKNT